MKRFPPRYGWLFQISTGLCQYYGFFLVSLASVCMLATVLGGFPLVAFLWSAIGVWLVRFLVFFSLVLVMSIVFESWRN
jgi:hypothetical protein